MKAPEPKPRRRIKKVKAHGGHHGGAWKVAYADFVTAMMALFLVLWLVSQADMKLKQAIANYFRSPGVFNTMQGGILQNKKKLSKEPELMSEKEEEAALSSAAIELRKQFESRPEFGKYKDQIKIEITPEGLKIQILDKADRVSFASGSAGLTDEARLILGEIAHAICALPNPIHIGGHTDRHLFPEGSTYTNWELSADRANAARRALEAQCVKPSQIQRIVGYADTDLLVPEDPYAAANRRISILVKRLHVAPSAESKQDASESQPRDDSKKSAAQNDEKENDKATTDNEDDKRLREDKLRSEGSISVGTPDKVPRGVPRTRAMNRKSDAP
jgi:chemotaxis protein MotB